MGLHGFCTGVIYSSLPWCMSQAQSHKPLPRTRAEDVTINGDVSHVPHVSTISDSMRHTLVV